MLCPKCSFNHVVRTFEDDTTIDIEFRCHNCRFEYSILTIPDLEMESRYDQEGNDGSSSESIPSRT